MDPAYIVSLAVFPDQRIVLADHSNPMWSTIAGVAATSGCPDRW
jgi:hypothetical protein